VARRAAVDEVEREGFEDRVVLGAENGYPLYVIQRSERDVVRRHRWIAVGGVLGGAALALACLAGLLQRLELLGR
jgi:hypothetical protein